MKKEDAKAKRAFEQENIKIAPSAKMDYRLSASSMNDRYANLVEFEQEIAGSRLNPPTEQSSDIKNLLAVISAAFLITSNTVGASMMVLPGLAQGPGMIASSALFGAIYLVNLVSGLLIAEVAINQYESSPASCEVPSSFKEFADENLQSDLAGNCISAISLFINTCVLSYDLVTAGRLTNQAITNDAIKPLVGPDVMNLISSSENTGLFLAAAFFVTLVSTQSGAALSIIASICCITLFVCFAGLVVPGLATIHDPLATFAAKGTSEFGSDIFVHDISTFVPVLLTAMVYQNIVPTITKMLNYDRDQTFKAITFGSAIPMMMYIAFSFTVLGGGALPGTGSGNMFLTGIMASSVFGSAMACVISMSEELDVFFGKVSECELPAEDGEKPVDLNKVETASFPSVVGAITVPILAGVFFAEGDGFVKALSVSGSYGSPLLYGVVPVALAFTQRTAIMKEFEKNSDIMDNVKVTFDRFVNDDTDKDKQIVPGGMVPLGALAAGAAALMATHLVGDVSSLAAVSSVLL